MRDIYTLFYVIKLMYMVSEKYRNASIYFERINEILLLYLSNLLYSFNGLNGIENIFPHFKEGCWGGLSILNDNSYFGTYHRKGLLTGKIMTLRKFVNIPGQRASGRTLTGYHFGQS